MLSTRKMPHMKNAASLTLPSLVFTRARAFSVSVVSLLILQVIAHVLLQIVMLTSYVEVSAAATTLDLEPSMAIRAEPIDLKARAPKLLDPNDVYSEALYQSSQSGAAEMLRVRHEFPLGTLASRLYVGAVLERSFAAAGSAPIIESATSPEVGIFYHPFSPVTIWAEYRYRAIQQERSLQYVRSVNDPRAGIAAGRIWSAPAKQFVTEVYGESVVVPRFSATPTTSGFLRTQWDAGQFQALTLSLYAELNEFTSPDRLDIGPSRLLVRTGARGTLRYRGWIGSLFAYRPTTISSLGSPRELETKDGFEAFFVFGGRF